MGTARQRKQYRSVQSPWAACRFPGTSGRDANGRARHRGFTIVELLAVLGIIFLLLALLVPTLRSARDRSRLAHCATNMRALGQGLHAYATASGDLLPFNWRSWEAATVQDTYICCGNVGWMGRIGRYLYGGPPWLAPLRCPASITKPEDAWEPGPEDPGSCWMLNAYCSGRKLGSIPASADGVLALEVGLWESRSGDTGSLEAPQCSWAYPHPAVRLIESSGWWSWLGAGEPPQRNILWCDAHVRAYPARTWPYGDQPFDPDRIRFMRFGLPGRNPDDPF